MASHVVVLLGAGKRQQVKTTPMMPLKQVVKTVCEKQGYTAENYGLKLNKNILDLSLTVRYANLAPGAKLEMIRVGASKALREVTIALQMEDGFRIIHTFPVTTSLWDILIYFESNFQAGSLNLTTRVAPSPTSEKKLFKKFIKKNNTNVPLFYQQPVCLLLNQEYATKAVLQSTTLQSAGITTGNAVLRVTFRHTELSLEGALATQETLSVTTDTSAATTVNTTTADASIPSGSEEESKLTDPNLGKEVMEDVRTSVQSEEIPPVIATTVAAATIVNTADTSIPSESEERSKLTDPNRRNEVMEDIRTSVQSEEQESITSATHEKPSQNIIPPISISPEIVTEKAELKEDKDVELSVSERLKSMEVNNAKVEINETEDRISVPLKVESIQPEATKDIPGEPMELDNSSISEPQASKISATQSTNVESVVFNRDIKIFNPPPNNVSITQIDLPDSFYELTAAEIQHLLAMQKSKRLKDENAGFKTSAVREQEEKAKEKKYPKTMIRVRFPDRFQLQATFLSKEKVSELYKFVRESLRTPERPFYLNTSPPKNVLSDQEINLYDAKLSPASVVHFSWAEKFDIPEPPYLIDNLLVLAEDFMTTTGTVETTNVAEGSSSGKRVTEYNGGDHLSEPSSRKSLEVYADRKKISDSGESSSAGASSSASSRKIPKWFKFG
ncbi:6560_t:CDS:10 [Ambispora gerdemannii]|uniref:6560_t:CDS:1 n=1 Tax=Ambispora gerdemannii TaxID=144530 RepID=A0A9N8YTG4_9GLOM|nr:6560_t:CDS:10 [Ambispora gerdemannii]